MKTARTLLPALCLAALAACSPPIDDEPARSASDRAALEEIVDIEDVSEPDDNASSEYEVRPADPVELPADDEVPDGSCAAEIGADRAGELVDQCLSISPATRPPCNALNSCDMIRDEIARGCSFGDGAGNPDFCAEYEQDADGG